VKIFDIFKNEDDLANWLESHGHNTKFRGSFSTVYILDEDLVIKETEDEAYLKFLEYVLASNSEHFPIVYDVVVINDCHYVLMERLSFGDDVHSEVQFYAESQGWQTYNNELWKGVYSKSFDTTLDYLEYYYEKCLKQDLEWDLRFTNIMFRGNVPVITDPFYLREGF
jgi:hypothetical protein